MYINSYVQFDFCLPDVLMEVFFTVQYNDVWVSNYYEISKLYILLVDEEHTVLKKNHC